MKMSNKSYDIMKWIAQVFLPAFITFYGVIGATCGIPYTEQTLTIMVAFDTFLGSVLQISNMKYNSDKEKWESLDEEE